MKLKIENLSIFIDNKLILENINLEFEEGLYVLKGPNGSGKTTFLNTIAGIPKYKILGKIYFNDLDITSLKLDKRAKLGIILVPQHLPKKTNIRLKSLIDALEIDIKYEILEKFLDKYIYEEFSGGEAKIVDFLVSLSLNPKVLLLDEIDSGLDENNIKFVADLLNEILDKTIIILTTHPGKILEYTKPKKVFEIRNKKIVEI